MIGRLFGSFCSLPVVPLSSFKPAVPSCSLTAYIVRDDGDGGIGQQRKSGSQVVVFGHVCIVCDIVEVVAALWTPKNSSKEVQRHFAFVQGSAQVFAVVIAVDDVSRWKCTDW